MLRLTSALAAIAFACLLSSPATAQKVCANGSIDDVPAAASVLLQNGSAKEVIVLQGEALNNYVSVLNAKHDMGIPVEALSHLVIIVTDKVAIILGFSDGCLTGKAGLPLPLHEEAYGEEV